MLSLRRAACAVVFLAIAASACGGDTPSATGPATTTTTTTAASADAVTEEVFEVRAGAVAGGSRRIESRLGATLRLVVRSDVADEVHLHGYDRKAEVAAGSAVTLELTTDIPGVFEIELEAQGLALGQLEVR